MVMVQIDSIKKVQLPKVHGLCALKYGKVYFFWVNEK